MTNGDSGARGGFAETNAERDDSCSVIQLDFHLPFQPAQLGDNYFVGAWHPSAELRVSCDVPPTAEISRGRNWFLLSARSSLHDGNHSLIHVPPVSSDLTAVVFRGYVLEPPLHSYSPSSAIATYWSSRSRSEHNGVFSAALILEHGSALELITDAFGIGPIYYRRLGRTVLFASSPRYLTTPGDRPDYLAWRCLVQSGVIAADRTLLADVSRVPAAHRLTFKGNDNASEAWFDYATLPPGERPVDHAAVSEAQEAFEVAVSRCLALENGLPLLALSSGWDSRRILGGLLRRRARFEARTVRVFHHLSVDVDATFASQMASDLRFRHQVVESAFPVGSADDVEEYVRHDRIRRELLDCESFAHTWSVPLMAGLPAEPCFLLDGLAGDVLGNSGFGFIAGVHDDPARDRFVIAADLINRRFDATMSSAWPPTDEVQRDIEEYLGGLPEGMNLSELAFLLLQTRRRTAPWAGQMLPPGHVVVCPFLELDHVRTMLQFNPVEKYAVFMERACLEAADPKVAAYGGSRAVPTDAPRVPVAMVRRRNIGCFRQLEAEVRTCGAYADLARLLSLTGRVRWRAVALTDGLASRSEWALRPIMELVTRHRSRAACWVRVRA